MAINEGTLNELLGKSVTELGPHSVEPNTQDDLVDNLNPVGRTYYLVWARRQAKQGCAKW